MRGTSYDMHTSQLEPAFPPFLQMHIICRIASIAFIEAFSGAPTHCQQGITSASSSDRQYTLQDWRSSMQGDNSSTLEQRMPTSADDPQPDIVYGPEGPSSFTMDQEAELPLVHPAELPGETPQTAPKQEACASGSNNGDGSAEDQETFLHHGGTLIVAPPSVVKLVWAPELASKVQCPQERCT